jgi:hypothetical protein
MKFGSTVSALILASVASMAGRNLSLAQTATAQPETPMAATAPTPVPALVPYSGAIVGDNGRALAGEASMTFLIFKDEQGGEPLFTETQKVTVDSTGHYEVQLGAANPNGLPAELFSTGEARWLEVQVAGEPVHSRVLLASVPYAMKAADAATLGGLPASAFALARPAAVGASAPSTAITPNTTSNVTTTGGIAGYVPQFSGTSSVVDSPIFVDATGNVDIGTASATTTLEVYGSTILNGYLVLSPTGTGSATNLYPSQYLKFVTSAYNSATQSIVQFNNTANPTGTLNLLASTPTTPPVETGLYFKSDGTIHFAPGQAFPGTGAITGVTAGTGLTGGGTSGTVTLNVDATKVPLLGVNNSFVGNQTVSGSVAANDSSAANSSSGITGNESAATGTVFGVSGSARSSTAGAAGIQGSESAPTGLVYGVLGTANSSTFDAAGVQGVENATTGQVYGVNGTSASSGTNSAGVGGYAMAKTGSVSGVSGYAISTTNGASGVGGYEGAATGAVSGVSGGTASSTNNAAGVTAYEGSATGQVYGVTAGTASHTDGAAGVFGYENAMTGAVFGVNGYTVSTTQGAAGVQGSDGAATGQVSGVYGSANSITNGAAGVIGQESAVTGGVFGVYGGTQSTAGIGVSGNSSSATGQTYGVAGNANSTGTNSAGVYGLETATTGRVFGVQGTSVSTTSNAAGVTGFEGATTGVVYGVTGSTSSATQGAAGVNGYQGSSTGIVYGVNGSASSSTNFAAGVSGYESATTGLVYGVYGGTASGDGVAVQGEDRSLTGGTGVSGITRATSGQGAGVVGQASDTTGLNFGVAGTAGKNGVGVQGSSPHVAVAGFNQDCTSSPCVITTGTAGQFVTGTGGVILQGLGGASLTSLNQVFYVDASGNGYFAGNLNVTGNVSKGGGSFKIDDPMDPANKYLSHSFVESPDMMNVYNGNVKTDKFGRATVELPEYFEALNRDFRYQLTVMGQFAQAIVATKIGKNRFVIRTNKPSVEVSWQVTGIRKDAYANANRIPTEEEKPASERGYYLHPELFDQPESKGIMAAHEPDAPSKSVASRSGAGSR